MRNPITTTLVLTLPLALALSACGNEPREAKDPTVYNTNAIATTRGPGSVGDQGGLIPIDTGTVPVSGAPASPMEGKCARGEPSREADDLESCRKSCRGLDDHVPLGSRCIPATTQCVTECDARFGEP